MTFEPIADRVLVCPEAAETQSAGGIILLDVAPQTTTGRPAIVRAVGPGRTLDNGALRPLDIRVGDRVLYSRYAGTEVQLDGEELLILLEDDILAAVSE